MKPPGRPGRQLAWPLLGLFSRPPCRPHPRPRPLPRQPHNPLPAFYHATPPLRDNEPGDVPRQTRGATAPKPHIDMRHIRENPELYAQNCRERNYPAAAAYPARINDLFAQWHDQRRQARDLRVEANLLRRQIANPGSLDTDDTPEAQRIRSLTHDELLSSGRAIKASLGSIEAAETRLTADMESLALALPNLTSPHTPPGSAPKLLTTINDHPEPNPSASDRVWRSHVHIGTELRILDLPAARKTSGWGWYYLMSAGAELEQALVSYALARAREAGFLQVSPPSLVYADIASACGFQPRDVDGLTQIYPIAQPAGDRSPPLVLAGTAEIPLAGMLADATVDEPLPLRRVAASRCYRAEAGARGGDTKGLYRVHEFTKVELFAWTAPTEEAATEVFDELVDLQTEILWSLGLHCRVLEMPATDLGASAWRKIDIEAFFPSRRDRDDGWGEVTSASICTDYQTRRLATRMPRPDGEGLTFPWTVNGTALAVPRVLAAILENGWDEAEKTVTVPEVLRPWMGGREKIEMPEGRHGGGGAEGE
ncbi:serine--tRNA ligase, chloroplastic/mitochondrial [Podospora conica]|nr:serine--tRNA ligase, chloroplastic/mitochondrial [Schizothecium conicum]